MTHKKITKEVKCEVRSTSTIFLIFCEYLCSGFIMYLYPGVFAKRQIAKRTQFGPLEGKIVHRSELPPDHMQWKVFIHS